MKLLNVLLILIFLTIPLGEIIRFELGNNIYLKPLDIFVGLSAFAVAIVSLTKRVRLPESYLYKPLVIFSSISLISLIINLHNLTIDQFFTALLYWIRFVSYASVYYLVLLIDNSKMKKIQSWLIVVGLVFIFIGFMQYSLYADLRNLYHLGWDEHNHRLFSSFLDPNFAGAFLVLILIYIISKIHFEILRKKYITTIIYGFIAVLNAIALLLTYSRSAFIMLIVGLGIYIFLLNKKRLFLLLIGLILLGLTIISPTMNTENTNLLRKTSSFARVETYKNAIQIIYDNPLFGVGFNAYRYAQERYKFRPIESKYPDHAEAGSDNSFLFVTATTGVFGLIAYLFILYSILKKAFKLKSQNNRFYPSIVIASIGGICINSFFINSLFFPPIMLWLWVIIGLMDRE